MLRALARHAAERGGGYAQWSPASLRVDGATVAVRAWRFAGGWAVVTEAVDDAYLAVACVGADPGGSGTTTSCGCCASGLDSSRHARHPV
jgi:hypothetical protein